MLHTNSNNYGQNQLSKEQKSKHKRQASQKAYRERGRSTETLFLKLTLISRKSKIPKDCVRGLEFGCRGPRLRAKTKDDEEKIKLGRERRRERDADNKEVPLPQNESKDLIPLLHSHRRQWEIFIKKYGFKVYWDHYEPLLNEFNHYCLPGVRVKVPKEEQKPTAEGEDAGEKFINLIFGLDED
ncbi:hypothetical protein C8F04DRAFT_1190332 [Mycena alexandri]|uniref:Uncharacterized protein n=1 Tax=Mycena alexandri TaxID=1745969 RepID=A0AAD6SJI8_9AGAR|nr:hypothetical protein C8F04DRAFT_1190332 [Mycena alexandri]